MSDFSRGTREATHGRLVGTYPSWVLWPAELRALSWGPVPVPNPLSFPGDGEQ